MRKATEVLSRRVAEQIAKQRARTAIERADELADDLMEGRVILDEDGQPFGTMRRLHDVAVFVVADAAADGVVELKRRLHEPSTRLLVRADEARITDLVFVLKPIHPDVGPGAAKAGGAADASAADPSPRAEAVRADEV